MTLFFLQTATNTAASGGNNQQLLLWALGLFGLGILLATLEIFIPSAGILGGLAGVAALASVACAFVASPGTWGPISLLALLVLSPAVITFGLKIWPNTPIGRALILGSGTSSEADIESHTQEVEDTKAAQAQLLGKEGVALTDLYPAGFAKIEGEKLDVLAQGGIIAAGTPVRIVEVVDNQIHVRTATQETNGTKPANMA